MTVLDILEEKAKQYPHKIVLADENETMTFSQLLSFARAIASEIIRSSNKRNRPVAVEVKRSIRSVAAFYGVLYSGNFFMPIDDNSPQARLDHMMARTEPIASISIGKSSLFDNVNTVKLNTDNKYKLDQDLLDRVRGTMIDIDPCYLIWTSGSTGAPKGVVINHGMTMDLIDFLVPTFNFNSEDIIGNQSPFYFDGAMKDVFIFAATGARLEIIPKQLFAVPIKLIEYLNEKKINSILWATSALNIVANSKVLDKEVPKYLEKVFFAGEALSAKVLNYWRKYIDASYINLYGPTEATVDATYYIVDRNFQDSEAIPIGRACPNMEVFLLDEDNNVVTDGKGEIVIRGLGVSMGYYNDFQRTDKVFIQDPRNPYYRDIIYKTGDIASYNDKGELVFASRLDNQIKYMGNRIELGEIERALLGMDKLDSGICLFDKDKNIIVFIYSGEEITRKEVFIYLRDKLPKYMFPNKLIHKEKLPLNQNGKIDRIKLRDEYEKN